MSLILYYDTLWGTPPKLRAPLPSGFEITTDRTRYGEAQLVVFHIPAWRWQPRWMFPKKLPHQYWVAWSLESAANYPRLADANFMHAFDGEMTYRLSADVPLPYFVYYSSPKEFLDAMQSPPQEKTALAPAVSFISSRTDKSGRRAYARELMRRLKTDSYGKVLNNAHLADDTWRPTKLKTIARYKFTLAFENSIAQDYVTEKFFDPLIKGSLPIYLGAPNVEELAPGDHCYINVKDYAGPRALADHLNMLAHDEDAYNAFFDWKQKPIRPRFIELVERHHRDEKVRLCEWFIKHTSH